MSLLKVLACSMPAQERAAAGACSLGRKMHETRCAIFLPPSNLARPSQQQLLLLLLHVRDWQRQMAAHVTYCLSVKPAQLCPALIWLHASVLQVTIGDDAEHPAAAAAALTDDAIAELLQQHLSISPAAFRDAATKQPPQFNGSKASSQGPKQQGQGPNKHLKTGSSGPKAQVAEYASVEAFVGVMGKLLDMERDAEVSAAQEATSLCSMSAAQVRKHRLHSQPPCLRRALHDFQGLCHLVTGACVEGQDKLPRKV
jgi:hypothetical protein